MSIHCAMSIHIYRHDDTHMSIHCASVFSSLHISSRMAEGDMTACYSYKTGQATIQSEMEPTIMLVSRFLAPAMHLHSLEAILQWLLFLLYLL